jgi:hypothetical protein
MEVKYQVFVSSTYKDLLLERQEVMQALLELDCIPVGMELFPATDDDQWTLIKRLIDDCDYYILIVAGRYGSINADGISYTQMEYEYAVSKGIPVISFLHKNPDEIAVGKSEDKKELKKKLLEFKSVVQLKMCKFYESPVELGSIVSRSLVRLIKDRPRSGWVKATFLPSEESTKEILELTKEIEKLKKELGKSKNLAPEGTEGLSQGDDEIEIKFTFVEKGDYKVGSKTYSSTTNLTWNKIFSIISPPMIDECPESVFYSKINELIRKNEYNNFVEEAKKADRVPTEFKITDTDFQTIKIQFRALNLISESIKKRGVVDKSTYWKLTPFGDTIMTRLRAVRK